ncbi:MAG: DMT family transporter [Pseudomonadota bacterium]
MAGLAALARADRAGLGIALTLVAWLLFAATDASVKWLVTAGFPAFQLAFMRYAVNLVLSGGIALRHREVLGGADRGQLALMLLRAFLLISTTVSNFIALTYIPLTVTAAILFSAPIVVCALSGPLLGERVGPWRWLAVLIGFAGVLIVIQPFGAGFHWASLLAVYNACAMALFSLITRRLAGSIAPQTMQLIMGALGTITLLPAALWVWQTPTTLTDWALMVAIGAFAWTGHEFFARAHSFAEAHALMPYSYTYILYAALATYLLFGDVPQGWVALGATLIVVSGLLIWWRESLRRGRA